MPTYLVCSITVGRHMVVSNDALSSFGIVPVAVSILSAVSILFAFAVISRRALGLLSLDWFCLRSV